MNVRRQLRRSGRKRSGPAVAVLLGLLLLPRTGLARMDDISIGALTFVSLGAAGALVSGFGSFVHIGKREHSGWWGWLALASGASLTGGAIVLAEREADAEVAATIAIPVGVFTVVTGVVGLLLPTPETKKRRRRPWLVMPAVGATRGVTAAATYGVAGAF